MLDTTRHGVEVRVGRDGGDDERAAPIARYERRGRPRLWGANTSDARDCPQLALDLPNGWRAGRGFD
ncbi:hypothetical protein LRS13_25145 [Svornostia abyssi]|uniref:Uncharacterized protein n=1 Tax=Svornostia abyssi TaxID=2898438 RepID=A0ABY5PNV2_9ACTN|nr:hypothetical protein LRS13_25145 [Parviterribacteraceae bacterium J379]